MAKIKIDRQIHQIDAAGQVSGRIASQIATWLMGKNKPTYLPNVDNGDKIEVVNVDKMKFTGNKLEQKLYRHYSGYLGGLKAELLKKRVKENPARVLWAAVYNMLPKNKLRDVRIKRLIIK